MVGWVEMDSGFDGDGWEALEEVGEIGEDSGLEEEGG